MSTIEGPRAPQPTTFGVDDIPVVPWPSGEAERRRLVSVGRPLVLAIATGGPPPDTTGSLEDWVRVPVDIDELTLRRRTLHERWLAARSPLWLDEHGLVHRDGRWVALSAAQAAAAAPLLGAIGQIARRDDVRRACEDTVGERSDQAFAAVLRRLRAKLAELDAVLHRLSGGRLLLEVVSSPSGGSEETRQKQLHGIVSFQTHGRSEEPEWTQEIPRGC